jgi:hypothetical protein
MIGFIYLIRLREFVISNQNIYKLGATRQPFNKRMRQYSANSVKEIAFKTQIDDCFKVESELKSIFNKRFEKMNEYGCEYFKGSKDDMVNTIIQHLRSTTHKPDQR